MAEYALVKQDGMYAVQGLPTWTDDPDTLLVVVYGEGDCDTVREPGERMLRALYDTYQTSDDLKDGDVFTLDGRPAYRCSGVHVVPVED